ncbi:unnamed protein product [Protopolystoma xenopodis]|uniref:Uncharacterized protein n=1 Tax=Protopolystoma xenopodis TaxID=117903 RepID=A0A3S5C7G2_9PLAT|nr:unnamed protein product [Protopolystoma xenopodis]
MKNREQPPLRSRSGSAMAGTIFRPTPNMSAVNFGLATPTRRRMSGFIAGNHPSLYAQSLLCGQLAGGAANSVGVSNASAYPGWPFAAADLGASATPICLNNAGAFLAPVGLDGMAGMPRRRDWLATGSPFASPGPHSPFASWQTSPRNSLFSSNTVLAAMEAARQAAVNATLMNYAAVAAAAAAANEDGLFANSHWMNSMSTPGGDKETMATSDCLAEEELGPAREEEASSKGEPVRRDESTPGRENEESASNMDSAETSRGPHKKEEKAKNSTNNLEYGHLDDISVGVSPCESFPFATSCLNERSQMDIFLL